MISKTDLMIIANQFVTEQKVDRSTAVKMSHKAVKLKETMRTKTVSFRFYKKDGSIREAEGTLNPKDIDYDFKDSDKKERHDLIKYWDLEKKSFRCFNVGNLITV